MGNTLFASQKFAPNLAQGAEIHLILLGSQLMEAFSTLPILWLLKVSSKEILREHPQTFKMTHLDPSCHGIHSFLIPSESV